MYLAFISKIKFELEKKKMNKYKHGWTPHTYKKVKTNT